MANPFLTEAELHATHEKWMRRAATRADVLSERAIDGYWQRSGQDRHVTPGHWNSGKDLWNRQAAAEGAEAKRHSLAADSTKREEFLSNYHITHSRAVEAGLNDDWSSLAAHDREIGRHAPGALSDERVKAANAFLEGKLGQTDYRKAVQADSEQRAMQRTQQNTQRLAQGVDAAALARVPTIPASVAQNAHDLSRREQNRTPTSEAHGKAQQNLHSAAEKNTAAEKSFMQTAKDFGAKKLSDLVAKPAAEQVRGIKAWGEAFVSRANLVAAGQKLERVATQAKDFCRDVAQSAREAVGGVKSADLEKSISRMDLGRDQQTRDQAKASVAAGPAFDKKSLQEKRACVALQGASNDAERAAKDLKTGMKELGIDKLSDAKKLDGAGKEKLAGMLNEYNTAHRHLGKCAEKVADVRQNEARQVQQREAGKEKAAGAQQQLGSFMRQRQEAQAKAKEQEQSQGAKKGQEEQQQARPAQKKPDERVLGG